jgi:hypothetical protein
MRKFLFGLLVGVIAMYCYLTGLDALEATILQWWQRASSPSHRPSFSDER